MQLLMPRDATSLAPISAALDAASPEARKAWIRSLNGAQQYRLYELAKGNPVSVADLVPDDRVAIGDGRNGLGLFNKFQKRFARVGSEVGGYNDNSEIAGPLSPIVGWFTGPGHFVAYDSPDVPGEVWIDYRRIPSVQHPEFPPLIDNESGFRSLVFGNMVDVLRRVSQHVFVGDSFKNFPRTTPMNLGSRIGSRLATAPFVIALRA
jgi:hypothetical protein